MRSVLLLLFLLALPSAWAGAPCSESHLGLFNQISSLFNRDAVNEQGETERQFLVEWQNLHNRFLDLGYSSSWVQRNFIFLVFARYTHGLRIFEFNDPEFVRLLPPTETQNRDVSGLFAVLRGGEKDIHVIGLRPSPQRGPSLPSAFFEELLHSRFQIFLDKLQTKENPPFLLRSEGRVTESLLNEFSVKELQLVFGRQKERDRALVLSDIMGTLRGAHEDTNAFANVLITIATAAANSPGQTWRDVSLLRILRTAIRIQHPIEFEQARLRPDVQAQVVEMFREAFQANQTERLTTNP